MKILLIAALIVCCATYPVAAAETSLPRSSPEDQGISSASILAFVEAAEAKLDALHSVMVVRHGHVAAEGWWAPYAAGSPHSLYSLSKSFTATAVGLAVAEGKLSVDDPVLKFFPEDAPEDPSNNLKSMRISDLLRMSTGQQAQASLSTADRPWTREFLAQPVPFKPGTHFLYNTPATYMLSAIVQEVTGLTVLDYLRPRLFEPLGIDNPTWGTSPQGISLGGYGLSVRTEDIARFGQLYLQKGKWGGKTLVPEAWVDAATARQTSNGSNPASDWDQGYGYQFWRCRHGAFRGDGAFGQFCIVLPEQDAVIAITSGLRNLQAVLDLVWEHLLPAMKPTPQPADPAIQERLRRKLAGLSLRTGESTGSRGAADRVSGKTYAFPANDGKIEAIAIERDDKGEATTLMIRTRGVDRRIACAPGRWIKGRLALDPLTEQPAAASGGWTSDETFEARICFYETPYLITLRLKFEGDRVLLDAGWNVSFDPAKQPQLVGRAE
jgi:CubicO group peptidase (beta-lactamase class C family)